MRKTVVKIYFWILALGLPYAAFCMITGKKIGCYYYDNFGIQCPACGTTRMCLSILKLDLISAFKYNPAVFIIFIYWNIIGVLCFIDKFNFVKNKKFLYISLFASIVIMLLFGFLRIYFEV